MDVISRDEVARLRFQEYRSRDILSYVLSTNPRIIADNTLNHNRVMYSIVESANYPLSRRKTHVNYDSPTMRSYSINGVKVLPVVPTLYFLVNGGVTNLSIFMDRIGINIPMSSDTALNLAWYITSNDEEGLPSRDRVKLRLNNINSSDDIMAKWGKYYDGYPTPAAIIYAYISGYKLQYREPLQCEQSTMEDIKKYPIFGVLLTFHVIMVNSYILNFAPPNLYNFDIYRSVAYSIDMLRAEEPNEYERNINMRRLAVIYACLRINSIEDIPVFMRRLGIVPPVDDRYYIKYLLEDIFSYGRMFNREAENGFMLIPDITIWGIRQILNDESEDMDYYSDVELYSKYTGLYDLTINDRKGRVRETQDQLSYFNSKYKSQQWRFEFSHCSNLDVTLDNQSEVRDDIESMGKDDIVVSYGNVYDHRCYTLSSLLEASGKDARGIYAIRDPQDLSEYNSIKITNLKILLSTIPDDERSRVVTALLANIDEAIKSTKNSDRVVSGMMAIKLSMEPEWQTVFDNFLWWFLIFVLWIRKWKGPGNDYPLGYDNANETLCEVAARDDNINVESNVIGVISSGEWLSDRGRRRALVEFGDDESKFREYMRNHVIRVLGLPNNTDIENDPNIRKISDAFNTLGIINHTRYDNAKMASSDNGMVRQWLKVALLPEGSANEARVQNPNQAISREEERGGHCLSETAGLMGMTADYLIYALVVPESEKTTVERARKWIGDNLQRRIKEIYQGYTDVLGHTWNIPPGRSEPVMRYDILIAHAGDDMRRRTIRYKEDDRILSIDDAERNYHNTISPGVKFWVVLPEYAYMR